MSDRERAARAIVAPVLLRAGYVTDYAGRWFRPREEHK